MKKQIALTALGLLTLAGGSWLAAQQRDSVRTTRANENVPEPSPAFDASEAPRPAIATRPSGASSPRFENPRVAHESSNSVDNYADDGRYFSEMRVTGHPMQTRMTPENAARMRAFQEAIRALRGSENEEDKSAARELVTKLVSEQLDADLASRETELTAIEQRAKDLRKQLDERKTAKPELLKMLVMLIDNPQVGLGIPPEWMQLLMRGQADRNRQGQTSYVPFEIAPGTPTYYSSPLMLPKAPGRPEATSDGYFERYPQFSGEPLPPAEPPRHFPDSQNERP